MKKKRIVLDIGFSPGDIVVFTAAVKDLCEQHPELEVVVNTCCPQIFENNPYLYSSKDSKARKEKNPIIPLANNLLEAGFDLYDIATNHGRIWQQLLRDHEITAIYDEDMLLWKYYKKDNLKLPLYKCKKKKSVSPEIEYIQVQYEDIHNSGWSGRHFSTAYYIELREKLKINIRQSSLLPNLHLSDEEKGWSNQAEDTFGYKGKFWLINSGHKNDYPLKQWGVERWQKLVDLLKGEVQFIQIGEKGDNHNHVPLKHAFDLVGKTDLRQLIRLTYHAEGGVSHVSLLHHLMAAWEKPCVTIAGGREPRAWENYPGHRYIDTNGQLECCKGNGCWLSGKKEPDENKKCKNMVGCEPRCMSMIAPEQVAREILNYYKGGRLKF